MVFHLKRYVSRGLCLLTLLAAPCLAQVTVTSVPAPGPETAELVERIRALVSRQVPSAASSNLRITVGASALRDALAADESQPTLAVFLSSVEFEAALGTRKRPSNLTAIFSNPDPLDQLSLAQALLGRARIGVIDSETTKSLTTRITNPTVQKIATTPDQSIDALLRETTGLDALIVLPDSTLNRSNINHVVRTFYQRRAVLIGYSQTMTRVGSLASIFVSADAQTNHTIAVVRSFSETGVLPHPVFINDVSVAVNQQLARSLNIALPTEVALLNAVTARRKETAP
jgi:hypothetical protein